jgi:sporulation protein YlmC with PRC-barrel domain
MADVTKITTGSLIAAEKVEGTNVYNLQGEKLGTVDDIMIDKISGRAIYAVMSFGGFLGMGEKQHPLPWSSLKYDERQGGYVVNLDKNMLENPQPWRSARTLPERQTTAAGSTILRRPFQLVKRGRVAA